jgi:hypothetical protein
MKNQINLKVAKVLGLSTITAMAAMGFAALITVAVDGQKVEFIGTQPMKMGGRVMVPLRGVFEKMGADVDWNQADQMVMARKGETKVELRINNTQAFVNGQAMMVQNPPVMVGGSTMVPIRFISESLGALVDWDETAGLVSITTNGNSNDARWNKGRKDYNNRNEDKRDNRSMVLSVQPKGSVIPVKLDQALDSSDARVGDKFTATIDTKGGNEYFGLPEGTKVEGHVSFAQAKKDDTPGVLGLIYDNIVLSDGRKVPIEASLIGLDTDSVKTEDGRLIAKKTDKKKEDMKYVGTGAGAGALLAIVTKGNIINNTLIGGALGYLYQQILGNKSDVKDVKLDKGAALGVRMDREASIRIYDDKK